jgi:hypothetical protein
MHFEYQDTIGLERSYGVKRLIPADGVMVVEGEEESTFDTADGRTVTIRDGKIVGIGGEPATRR